MVKTYTKAPDDVRDMCVGLMQRNHPKLAEFQLRVDVVFVATDSETANALSCGGYPAQAAVARALPTHMKPERFIGVALTAMTTVPKLKDCTQATFFASLLFAAHGGTNKTHAHQAGVQ